MAASGGARRAAASGISGLTDEATAQMTAGIRCPVVRHGDVMFRVAQP